MKQLTLPLTLDERLFLRAGDVVSLSGVLYTARDAAHKRMVEALASGAPLPFPLRDSAIYYCGPTPAAEHEIIGSCGPTTSARMDAYAPTLLDAGNTVMIGKGKRDKTVMDAIVRNKAVYFAAIGGAAALIKSCVKQCDCVAYAELGCEAVYRLTVENFVLIVAVDAHGNTILQ